MSTNRTSFVYDNLGRRITTVQPLPAPGSPLPAPTTHTAYDPEGRVLATWGATYPVAYEYDDQGRMSALYTYRGTNEITSVADILTLKPAMDKTTWVYDPATGLLTQKLDADNKGATYTYTPAGQLSTRTWARGVATTYDYDPVTGSLTDVDYSDATPDVVNTYDRMGRQLTSATLGVVTNTFAYDPASLHLTTETWQGLVTDTLTRSADTLGRNAGFQTLGGMSLDYAYDATGRFAAITSVVATVTNVATYAYVPNSRLLTGYSMGGFTRTVDYEPDRNLIAGVVNTFGTNLVSRFDYTNDALGRRTQRLDTGTAGFQPATNSFAYNIRSELTAATFNPLIASSTSSATYSYDPIGNRIQAVENTVQTDYVSNMLNQYTAINAASPSYDDDGNMLTTGSGWTLGWDGENRLVTASNANTVITNTYDHRSRRIRKQVADAGTPVSDKRFFYDGWSLLHEHDVLTGNPVTHYLWGLDLSGTLQGAGGVGGLLAEIRSGQAAASASDANGNITEYINGSTGALSARYAYDGFGKTIASSGPSAVSFSHRFSSKYLDAEIGWYYYGYRFYAPEIGRWPSRDPMEEEGGINLLSFSGNNSVDEIDYLGLTLLDDLFEKAPVTISYNFKFKVIDITAVVSAQRNAENKCCLDISVGLEGSGELSALRGYIAAVLADHGPKAFRSKLSKLGNYVPKIEVGAGGAGTITLCPDSVENPPPPGGKIDIYAFIQASWGDGGSRNSRCGSKGFCLPGEKPKDPEAGAYAYLRAEARGFLTIPGFDLKWDGLWVLGGVGYRFNSRWSWDVEFEQQIPILD